MPAIITSKFRRNNAQAFETSFGSSGNKYYLGIGKPSAFGTKKTNGRTENLGTIVPITAMVCNKVQYFWWFIGLKKNNRQM